MKYGLKVPVLCRSRFHNRIYSLPCAKICYTDPQHDIWLLHRILDHMTPWISFYFRGRIGFGAIVASKLLCYKLIEQTKLCCKFVIKFIKHKVSSNNVQAPNPPSQISSSSQCCLEFWTRVAPPRCQDEYIPLFWCSDLELVPVHHYRTVECLCNQDTKSWAHLQQA